MTDTTHQQEGTPEAATAADGDTPTELTGSAEWVNLAAVKAIAAGLSARYNDIRNGMATGRVRNTARNRGYMDALADLHHNLTYVTGEEGDETP